MQRLADDGPDSPENVAAVCPNCHRRAHYSSDRTAFNAQLRAQVGVAEREVSGGGQVG
jgi:5-methylcytosine-specific restriction protein A